MPGKQWDDEEGSAASSADEDTAPKFTGAVRRNKFDDEEGGDSDVLDSWDAEEDSEAEREKAKKAAEAKAKAAAEAKASKKSKTQRMKDHIEERQRKKAEAADDDDEDGESDETEGARRERLRRIEKEADLRNAEDLFGGDVGSVPSGRKATTAGAVVSVDAQDPGAVVDLSSLPLFRPVTKLQFEKLRDVLVPIIGANAGKPQYALFLGEFAKQLARDLPSDQIKKVASGLAAASNEKQKLEKAADKSTKKTKAAKTKTTLAISRPSVTDTTAYDDEAFGDDDFM